MTVRTRLLATLLALVGLVATACSQGPLADGGPEPWDLTIEFERTYNLFPGSPVRVLGVEAGKVTDIDTDPSSALVTVTVRMDGEVSVPADARAVIVPAALLGERYVQLDPPWTGGPTIDRVGATIPVARTVVPSEFDEVLESLNNFVGEVDDEELGRLVENLAATLDGNGAALGATIDAARGAIGVLRDNDEELLALVARLSDLNETIGSRDRELAALLQDFDAVMTSLADDRGDIDAALRGLVRVSNQLSTLLERHRPDLEADIETLTRVGRTAQRNLDQISLSILSQAELFRHSERVLNTQKNWLPLVDHAGELAKEVADTISRRLVGVCLRAGLPEAECQRLAVGDLVPRGICLPPIVACPEPTSEPSGVEDVATVGETLRRVVDEVPAMADALRQDADERREQHVREALR